MRCLGDVFLEFLAPALESEEPLCQSENLPRILDAAFEIWNAACREAANPGTELMRSLRERYETAPGVSIECVEMLISRKRERYGDDQRLLAKVELARSDEGEPAIVIEEAGLPADFHEGDLPGSETGGGTVSMTQALLEFAIPFVGAQPKEEDLRIALGVAVEIWNASVTDALDGGGKHVLALKRRYARALWPPSDIVAAMIQRKRRHFGADLRLVGHFAVRKDAEGHVIAHAEAEGYRPTRLP